ncbi:MAG: quinone-interacting membrane-bound oxidoreductase complex subunit QmoC [Deltaproteobacteria bacterium]|nr:quinone-interacting membrane-bound oxidoreductase complex subunit QmoC [Deltaproteobacteria bacterium]
MKVNPDLEFVRDLIRKGGSDVKKCSQCATCSVVCPLSPANRPYPRKEMIWASWGLADKLAGDPDVWLCHQCGDCSTQCTRDARPGDVLAALRLKAIEHFAFPGFMGKLAGEPRLLPVLLLIAALFLGLMVVTQQALNATAPLVFQEAHFEYEEFLSHPVIIGYFTTAFLLAIASAAIGAVRFWRAMEATAADWGTEERESFLPALVGAVGELLWHSRFHRCEVSATRRSGHLLVFYGFLGLLVVTSIATLLTILELPFLLDNPHLYPLGWGHPVKIAGNLAGLALVGGCGYVWYYRATNPEQNGKSTYADWLFLGLLLAVGLTGFGTEFVRLTPIPAVIGTPTYLVHLVAVFCLLIFLPYTKFAHFFYRLLAMTHARSRGRAVPPER